MTKVLIIILTYNAERHIAQLLARLPAALFAQRPDFTCDILLLDDASPDATLARARDYITEHTLPISLIRNPINQGYGGNQKIGYTYAIEHGYDIALMLHGDGQYPPEKIHALITPLLKDEADVVLGSRMLEPGGARRGGMPLYKYIGNKILPHIQNRLLKSHISEFHTGFRAYAVPALRTIPFTQNSNDFDFDTDILIQCILTHKRIAEIPIPTHYGDEICHVNGIKYAAQVVRNTLLARFQRHGIFYNPKFDFDHAAHTQTNDKTGFASSQSWAVRSIPAGSTILDIATSSPSHVTDALQRKNCTILRHSLLTAYTSADSILLLDSVDHMENPEAFLRQLHTQLQQTLPRLYITTGNVGFFLVRLNLLFGHFNYNKRGILDLNHKRLFTFASLRQLLESHGYRVESVEGIPAPFPLAFRSPRLAKILLALNGVLIRLNKPWFSYQIAIIARPLPSLERLMQTEPPPG